MPPTATDEKLEGMIRDLADKFGKFHVESERRDVALSGEIATLGVRVEGRIAILEKDLGGRITTLEKDLGGRITTLEKDLGGRITTLEKDLGGKITALDKRVDQAFGFQRWLAGFLIPISVSLIGSAIALAYNAGRLAGSVESLAFRVGALEEGLKKFGQKLDQVAPATAKPGPASTAEEMSGRPVTSKEIQVDGQIVEGMPIWTVGAATTPANVIVNPGDTIVWRAVAGEHGLVFSTQTQAEAFLQFSVGGGLPKLGPQTVGSQVAWGVAPQPSGTILARATVKTGVATGAPLRFFCDRHGKAMSGTVATPDPDRVFDLPIKQNIGDQIKDALSDKDGPGGGRPARDRTFRVGAKVGAGKKPDWLANGMDGLVLLDHRLTDSVIIQANFAKYLDDMTHENQVDYSLAFTVKGAELEKFRDTLISIGSGENLPFSISFVRDR